MDLEQAKSSTHGHEIMRLIAAMEGRRYTREELQRDVASKFGPDARFHACAGDDMSLDELLTFLKERGKVVETIDGIGTDLGQMCSHDEEAH